MDILQAEHRELCKQSQLSKTIEITQEVIEKLQNARNTIANDPPLTQTTLAKLQNPVKTDFSDINGSLKNISIGHGNYQKALNKLFKDKPLPSSEFDALSAEPGLVNRAIYLHLLREGLFSVAKAFREEASVETPGSKTPPSLHGEMGDGEMKDVDDISEGNNSDQAEMDQTQEGIYEMEKQFANMYTILQDLRDERNVWLAIQWARQNSYALEARGSNLEFELCRLDFINHVIQKLTDMPEMGNESEETNLKHELIGKAREDFRFFYGRYPREVQQLMAAIAFWPNLEESPYRHIFLNPSAWDEIARSFTKEFCSLMELSADSPLYVAATAGAIALPTLQKYQKMRISKRTEWTTDNELAVEIALPPSYQFHSIFVCPVSKEQTTDENPAMMMPCGHVVASESLNRLSKGNKFKCPYCPNESHPREAKKIFF
ncbi:MAG: hypothetical protein Q9227_000470 [Pyrenula ochraceoflavens]